MEYITKITIKKSTSEDKTIKIGCACKLLHVTVQQYSTSTEKDNKIALSKKKKIKQRNKACTKVIKAPIVGLSN